MRRLPFATTLLLAAACEAAPGAIEPPAPEERVAILEVVSGAGQRIWSGRRSPLPFRVRALDPDGAPVEGADVRFRVTGEGTGTPTQPLALTDREGYAESWLQYTRSGPGTVVVEAGAGRAELAFVVDRAPGEIRFLPGTGAVGIPGLPHPDSILEVRLLDTEGRPLGGHRVWFAAAGRLSEASDTTDAEGRAGVRLRRTDPGVGPGTVYAFVIGFPEVLGRAHRPVERPVNRVVLVSVDGLRADAAERWDAPTLERLAREGATQPRARVVSPALTGPGHLSLLSGVRPAAHGVFTDELRFTPEMARLDPLFRHATRRGRRAVAFMSREGPLAEFERALACRLAFGLDSLYLTAPRAEEAVTSAAGALADPEMDLVFLHLPDPDVAGHRHGFTSPEYGAAVREVDAALERVRRAVEAIPGTLLLVTSDHGGGGDWGPHQHGSGAAVDQEVPLLLWGARVVPGALGEATLLDVAPTVLWALGLAPPPSYEGRILLDAFHRGEGTDG